MSMLAFVYLVLILGWILIILFLKCKKSLTHHIGFTDNYTDAIGSDQRQPTVHVIHLQNDDLENEYQLTDECRRQSSNLVGYSQQTGLSVISGRSLTTTFTPETATNLAYSHDEVFVINAPPPSYDEVMRQPEIYPKVNNKITRETHDGSKCNST